MISSSTMPTTLCEASDTCGAVLDTLGNIVQRGISKVKFIGMSLRCGAVDAYRQYPFGDFSTTCTDTCIDNCAAGAL
jgi:hypothetical protein